MKDSRTPVTPSTVLNAALHMLLNPRTITPRFRAQSSRQLKTLPCTRIGPSVMLLHHQPHLHLVFQNVQKRAAHGPRVESTSLI